MPDRGLWIKNTKTLPVRRGSNARSRSLDQKHKKPSFRQWRNTTRTLTRNSPNITLSVQTGCIGPVSAIRVANTYGLTKDTTRTLTENSRPSELTAIRVKDSDMTQQTFHKCSQPGNRLREITAIRSKIADSDMTQQIFHNFSHVESTSMTLTADTRSGEVIKNNWQGKNR